MKIGNIVDIDMDINIKNIKHPPISPTDIQKELERLFLNKPLTEQTKYKILEWKKHWVYDVCRLEGVKEGSPVEQALTHYINLFDCM